ncbi:MAG: C40 family peptidase [Armatimonadota bacterium]
MHRRLLIIGLLVLVEVLWLLGGAVTATESNDYEVYVAASGQTVAAIAEEYGIDAAFLAQVNKVGANVALQGGHIIIIPSNPPPAVTTPEQASNATATTPAGNAVQGKLGTVIASTTKILAQPGPGKVYFNNAVRGTDLLVLGMSGEYYGVMMADGNIGYILKKAVGLTERFLTVDRPEPPPPPPAPDHSPLIETAFTYMGTPYRYGGRLPANVDCSLLVQTVFAKHGLKLPRVAADQFNVGQPMEVQELQPGDRLYFYNRARTKIGHTGLYIGDGQFIHASSNRGKVAVDELDNPTYWSIYAGARR